MIKFITGLALAVSCCMVLAGPTTTDDEGYRTEIVTVVIGEPDLTQITDTAFGVQLRIDYTLKNLKFVSASANNSASLYLTSVETADYAEPNTFNLVPGSLSASLAYPDPIHSTAIGGFELMLNFEILIGADTGATKVWFSCDDFGLGRPCVDYDFERTFATVTVLDRTPIPLPGTLPLLGLGVAALWWTRRRIA